MAVIVPPVISLTGIVTADQGLARTPGTKDAPEITDKISKGLIIRIILGHLEIHMMTVTTEAIVKREANPSMPIF
jgi:hypothetical protein